MQDAKAFSDQDQQTLTEFDDDGHVIRRWNKNNDNPDESETNPQLSQRSDAGKLYVISVWGTGDSNQEKIVEASRKKFDAAMKQCGLSLKSDNDAGNFVAEYITLTGKNATRKNVLKTCKDVSLQAKKNDVIFVYMLCNGCTKAIHFKANQDGHSAAPVRGHFLFPGVENISQALENPKKYGILRSEIIQALKPNDHRLVVLITDAPSVYSDDGVFLLSNKKISDKMVIFSNSNAVCYDPVPLKSFDYSGNPDYRLRVFLRNTTGIIDWNSSSPNRGIYRLGEYSFANNAGSLFTQAFTNFACKQTDSNIVARADNFYTLLGSVLADSYNEFKTKTRKTDDNNILLRQEQQTLTEFSNGVSIKREWSKDYLHEEVDIGF